MKNLAFALWLFAATAQAQHVTNPHASAGAAPSTAVQMFLPVV
jgi:hypothetical protein